jgi:phosphomannomutase
MGKRVSRVFIFDVDGTLTPSRQPMTNEFQEFFKEWVKTNTFYLVTGSDIVKLQEQMCMYDIEAHGIFTCCGNEYWQPDPAVHPKHCDLIYEKKFKPSEKLIKYLELELKFSPYKKQYGNHIEDRGTLLNFSIVGRDCTQEQREDYNKYDTEKGERKRISEAIKRQFPDLDAVLGGQISIDIYPKGNDKSQVLEHIEKQHENDELIFIGDGIENGGNDYPLAHLMDGIANYNWYQTEGWKQTKLILEKLNG